MADTDLAVLRIAGLSARKAEYGKFFLYRNLGLDRLFMEIVQDLATRFADGRLSTDKLLQANDEELAEMLTQVRGIGRVSLSVSNRTMFLLTCFSGLVYSASLFLAAQYLRDLILS